MDELTNDQHAIFVELFKIIDVEKVGCITVRDITMFSRNLGINVTESAVQDMINEADTDGNGSLEMNEFITGLVFKMSDVKSSDELRDAFNLLDNDKSGSITVSNVRRMFSLLGIHLSEDNVEEMIVSNDSDYKGDGAIVFEDFVDLMTSPGF